MPWEPPAVTTAGHQAKDPQRPQVWRGNPSLDSEPLPSSQPSPASSRQAAAPAAVAALKPFKLNPSACEFVPAALRAAHSPAGGSFKRAPAHPPAATHPDPTVQTSPAKGADGLIHHPSRKPPGQSDTRQPSHEERLSQRDGWAQHAVSGGDSVSPTGHPLDPCNGLGRTVSPQQPALDHQLISLTELPAEVLACIVSELNCLQDIVALAAVNKLLNALVSSTALSVSVSQSFSNSSTPLEHDGARSSRILSVIRTQFSGLQELDLQGCAVSDQDVAGLLVGLPRLERLTLSGCRKLSYQAVARILEGAEGSATRLRCLNMQRCFQLTAKSMDDVLAHCATAGQGVKTIAFSHLTMTHWPTQAALGTPAEVSGHPRATQLSVLALNNCGEITSQGLQAIASACPKLEHLLLGGSSVQPSSASTGSVEDPGRTAIAQMVQEVLLTVDNGRVRSAGPVATELIAAAQKLPALQTLELSFFPSVCLELCERLICPCTQQRVSVLNLCGPDLHRHRLAATSLGEIPGCGSDLASVFSGAVNCSNPVRQSPLHIAAELALLRNARILLQWGAAVDPRDKSGATPLFVACEHGHEVAASCLLEWGADPMRSNNSGESPLYIACLRGHWRVVEVLLRHLLWNNIPWELGEVYTDGWTPLMAATIGDHFDVSMLLLRAAGPLASDLIGATNRYGQTAMHLAARRGSMPLLRAMLQVGAGSAVTALDNTGATAADIAGYHGHTDMQRILRSCQAA